MIYCGWIICVENMEISGTWRIVSNDFSWLTERNKSIELCGRLWKTLPNKSVRNCEYFRSRSALPFERCGIEILFHVWCFTQLLLFCLDDGEPIGRTKHRPCTDMFYLQKKKSFLKFHYNHPHTLSSYPTQVQQDRRWRAHTIYPHQDKKSEKRAHF